jgi:hypothetical protein
MLDVGFVAKASSLRPKPSLLYLEAQMNGRNFSWVEKEATHSFMNLVLMDQMTNEHIVVMVDWSNCNELIRM